MRTSVLVVAARVGARVADAGLKHCVVECGSDWIHCGPIDLLQRVTALQISRRYLFLSWMRETEGLGCCMLLLQHQTRGSRRCEVELRMT